VNFGVKWHIIFHTLLRTYTTTRCGTVITVIIGELTVFGRKGLFKPHTERHTHKVPNLLCTSLIENTILISKQLINLRTMTLLIDSDIKDDVETTLWPYSSLVDVPIGMSASPSAPSIYGNPNGGVHQVIN